MIHLHVVMVRLRMIYEIDIRTEFSAADIVNAVSALLEHCSSPNESLVNDHVRYEREEREIMYSGKRIGIVLMMLY